MTIRNQGTFHSPHTTPFLFGELQSFHHCIAFACTHMNALIIFSPFIIGCFRNFHRPCLRFYYNCQFLYNSASTTRVININSLFLRAALVHKTSSRAPAAPPPEAIVRQRVAQEQKQNFYTWSMTLSQGSLSVISEHQIMGFS